MSRPSIYAADYDRERWSNHGRTSDGGRLSWRELAEEQAIELRRLRQFAQLLADLDRCEHGRHEGDPCTLRDGCGGPSLGNPLMACSPARTVTGLVPRQVGFGMDGSPIVIPAGREQRHPEAWRGSWEVIDGGDRPIEGARGGDDGR